MAQTQSGYVVLMMLALMLGGSAAVLSLVGQSGLTGLSLPDVVATQDTLRQSRQVLLSYAALYPYLYGPGGAGPGHLPCPDTDSNDGPDPPCGRQTVSRGRLPRQVSLSTGRYAFSELAEARLGYSVNSRVINNPVNRIVNPSTLLVEHQKASTLALISAAADLAENNKTRDVLSTVTSTAMLQAIRPVVAAWTIDRLTALDADRCALLLKGHDASDAPESARCQQARSLVERCGLASHDEPVKQFYWALLLADGLPVNSSCPDNLLGQLSVELVPMSRHWFFRNNWHQWVRIAALDNCSADRSLNCKLSYEARNDPAYLISPILLQRGR